MDLKHLNKMHKKLAKRGNASSQIVASMAFLGKPMYESFAAGLLSMGNIHAPIEKACRFFNNPRWEEVLLDLSIRGKRVPGFGSAFCKKEDPIIEEAIGHLPVAIIQKIETLTEAVHATFNPNLHPNAALATAAYALANDIPPTEAQYLVLQGRFGVWKDIYLTNRKDVL
tara:strand:- start:32434 stop:32943 length:510 start_codon:yes stop_codon:yes gene_type:complete